MSALAPFRSNTYSQNGEDGVLSELLMRLGVSTGFFVEFGAWDGKHLSNTYLLAERGWSGVMIESDPSRYQDLLKNIARFQGRISGVNAFVEARGDSSLDSLLATQGAPRDLDLLSIDVDSNDWQIWFGVRDYRAKIVVLEINSSIPPGVLQTHRNNRILGCSFSSAIALGKHKGYTPVCHTGNLFLVLNELVPALGLPEEEVLFPETLFDYAWVEASLPMRTILRILAMKALALRHRVQRR
jgi:hypothetical protein